MYNQCRDSYSILQLHGCTASRRHATKIRHMDRDLTLRESHGSSCQLQLNPSALQTYDILNLGFGPAVGPASHTMATLTKQPFPHGCHPLNIRYPRMQLPLHVTWTSETPISSSNPMHEFYLQTDLTSTTFTWSRKCLCGSIHTDRSQNIGGYWLFWIWWLLRPA